MFRITPYLLILAITLSPGLLYGEEAPVEPVEPVEPGAEPEEETRVVTRGSLGSRTESEVARPSVVLDGDELDRRRSGGTVGEVLDGVAGVSNADFGPGVGRPTIRGLQGSRVQVLEDGMRTTDVSGEGVDHIVAGEPLGAEAVEIIRGPATLLYGSGASGGVVNLVSGRFDPRIGQGFNGEARGSFGVNGLDRQGLLRLEAPVGDEMALRATITGRASEDFQISGLQVSPNAGEEDRGLPGQLINSSVSSRTYNVTGIWAPMWGHVGIGYERYEGNYGVPEAFDPVGGQGDEVERIFAGYHRLDLRSEAYDVVPGIEVLRWNLSLSDFDQEEDEFEFSDATGEQIGRVTEATFEAREVDSRLELSQVPLGLLRGVFGVDLNLREFRADDPREGRDFFIQPSRTVRLGVFLVEQLVFDRGEVEVGARVGWEEVLPEGVVDPVVTEARVDGDLVGELDPNPGVRRYVPTSLSMGGRLFIGDAQYLRATASRSQRTPGAEQLFAFGRHGAAGTWEIGDPDLNMETYTNGELTFHREAGATRFQATAFYNHVDDFVIFAAQVDGDGDPIRMGRDGQSVDDGGERLVIFEQADARFYGAELEFFQDFATGMVDWTWHLNGDLVFGELRAGGNLPLITPPRVGTGLSALIADVGAAVHYQWVFPQERVAPSERPTEGYHLVHADLRWAPLAHPGMEVFLRGRNLLNQAGRRHHSFFKDYAPILGRSVVLGASYRF